MDVILETKKRDLDRKRIKVEEARGGAKLCLKAIA
jgi:hypothetical protein